MPDVSIPAARSDRWQPADVGSAMTSRLAVSVVAVCAGYYLTGLFALVFTLSQTGIPVMWPPTAVLLAALLLAPARLWWVYLLAILPTHAHLTSHFQPGVTPVVILIQYVGHVTQVLLAAIMLRRFGGGRPRFDSLEGMTRYIAIAAIAAPALASVLPIVLFERVGWVSGFWIPWRQRFFASVIPALTVTPLIVMAAQQGVARTVLTSASRRVEFALLLAALLAVGIPVFGISVATRMVMPGLVVYALLPLLLWAATRFGTGGLSLSLLVVAVVALWDAIQGRGPFALSGSSPDNVQALQVFLLGLSLPLQVVAALVEERERTAEAFRTSDLRYRDVVDTQSELICRFLPDTTLTFVNDAYCRNWNKTKDELIGTQFLELIPEPARDLARAHVESVVRRPRTEVHEHEVLLPNGDIGWQEWVNHVIRDSNGNIVELQGIGRDISQRRRAENALREARNDLERVTRVTALGELAASIAHEVNQPLAAIAANANACVRWLDQGAGEAEVRKALPDIVADANRASAVIRRTRELCRQAPPERSDVDINALIGDVLALMRERLERSGVRLRTALSGDLPAIQGSPVQIEQVLLNLVLNAVDAVENVADVRAIRVRSWRENGQVCVSVEDSGEGFSSDAQDRLFTAFYTTKREGIGMGLAISRSIVEAHGGSLTASANAEGGATFQMQLPA